MHQIVCRLGLCPRPRWGSIQRFPRPLAGFYGVLLLREGRKDEGRGREGTPCSPVTPPATTFQTKTWLDCSCNLLYISTRKLCGYVCWCPVLVERFPRPLAGFYAAAVPAIVSAPPGKYNARPPTSRPHQAMRGRSHYMPSGSNQPSFVHPAATRLRANHYSYSCMRWTEYTCYTLVST